MRNQRGYNQQKAHQTERRGFLGMMMMKNGRGLFLLKAMMPDLFAIHLQTLFSADRLLDIITQTYPRTAKQVLHG